MNNGELPKDLLKEIELKSEKKLEVHQPDWDCNQLIEGDCLELLKDIPDKSIQLVLCDLPYGTTVNPWDSVIPLDKLWEQYRRVLTPKGVVVLTGQGSFTARLILSNEDWYRYKLTWIKSKSTNFLNAKKQPLRRHEDVCVFYPGQPLKPVYNPQMSSGLPYNKGKRKAQQTGSYGDFNSVVISSKGERYPTDVIYFKTAESEGAVYHPTQKPIALGRYLIRTYSNPGDVVLDNCFGSGSFLVAAIEEGRNFYGIELNKSSEQFKKQKVNFIDIAKERILKSFHYSTPDMKKDFIKKSGIFKE